MGSQVLRIVDANCNRIAEGFRFLEDVSRFILNDQALSQHLRDLRHSIVKSISTIGNKLISERNATGDVGTNFDPMNQHQDLPSLITANAKRIEEGLRVIEEMAKLPEMSTSLQSIDFQRARFQVYSIERDLIGKLLRKTRVQRIQGLYAIIDTEAISARDACDIASQMISGGAKIIQLRDKHSPKRTLFILAQKLKQICQESDAMFIINDHLDIALAIEADGLHIGQDDLPVSAIRNILPIETIIGCSAYSILQAQQAQADGADYIGAGAIFVTPTKKNAAVIGLDGLRQIRQIVAIPIVAIGGIDMQNIADVLAAGADAAAVISAITNSADIEKATGMLIQQTAINKGKKP